MDERHKSVGTTTPPCTMVIFGASGDLAMRKLLPALYNLDLSGDQMIADQTIILGSARSRMPTDEFRSKAREGIKRFSRLEFEPKSWDRFAARLEYLGGIAESGGFVKLRERIEELEKRHHLLPNRVFYLAIPPESYLDWVEQLHGAGLISPIDGSGFTRVVVEKPIGHDLRSATEINQGLLRFLDERQIFRIDHYLGKETVRNLLVLRFSNSVFEQVWNSHHIESVEITVAESEGLANRAGYYEHAGALRDMVQNHLLQLLSLIAMEPPATLDPEAVHTAKLNVMRAIKPFTEEQVDKQVVRARYLAGSIDGRPVCGYMEEDGVSPDSNTETYVALRLAVNNWRWSGVPFYLRTGKRLARRASAIAICFKRVPEILFSENRRLPANVLTLRIQPDEGFSLEIMTKRPGVGFELKPVRMDLHYAQEFGATSPDAYETLLHEVMLGDQTSFTRADWVELSWRVIQSVLDAWKAAAGRPMEDYPAGGWGPESAKKMLLNHDDWREP